MNGTFLKEGIDKIEELVQRADTRIIEVDGEHYATGDLKQIPKPYYAPETINLNSLDSLVDIIKKELKKITEPLFIRIISPTKIDVFTSFKTDDRCIRDYLYRANAELPNIVIDNYVDHESFIIALKSKLIKNEDNEYVLNLLSKITDTESVTSDDNGISQTVRAKKGVVMVENVLVRPIVNLMPYRTFLEVGQPESQFLLRLKEGGYVGIFEADGGAWKLEAKENINEYLSQKLSDEIIAGDVVVIA